jgi:hypothetical protein
MMDPVVRKKYGLKEVVAREEEQEAVLEQLWFQVGI